MRFDPEDVESNNKRAGRQLGILGTNAQRPIIAVMFVLALVLPEDFDSRAFGAHCLTTSQFLDSRPPTLIFTPGWSGKNVPWEASLTPI